MLSNINHPFSAITLFLLFGHFYIESHRESMFSEDSLRWLFTLSGLHIPVGLHQQSQYLSISDYPGGKKKCLLSLHGSLLGAIVDKSILIWSQVGCRFFIIVEMMKTIHLSHLFFAANPKSWSVKSQSQSSITRGKRFCSPPFGGLHHSIFVLYHAAFTEFSSFMLLFICPAVMLLLNSMSRCFKALIMLHLRKK